MLVSVQREMELSTIIIALCISLSFMLSPCASHQVMAQSSNKGVYPVQLTPPALPRKLKVNGETLVKDSEKKDVAPFNKPNEALSGKSHDKEANLMHAKKGTREEWLEGTDMSEYFTMDYSRVRRRRPIHNKSVPVAP